MARRSSPWYWEDRQRWYVRINGKWHNLGEHPAKAPKPVKKNGKWNVPRSIMQRFHELMVSPQEHIVVETNAVAGILDDFLGWTEENRAPNTYECYRGFCQSFIDECGSLTVSDLTTLHVSDWLRKKTTWNSTTKNDAITCIQRAFNWATRNRGLKYNPITGMEKPKVKTRVALVEPGEFDELLGAIADEEFRDLLTVSWECGCRPQEVKAVEARHVDLEKSRWVFPTQEGKGERLRVVYMTEAVAEIVGRLMKKHPQGPIFRNTLGNPWTGYAVKCRFEKLQLHLAKLEMERQNVESSVTDDAIEKLAAKLPKQKKDRNTGKMVPKKKWELRSEAQRKLRTEESKQYAKRFRQYDFRHTWITRKLIAGVDSHVVAALSGHADTKMIDRVYSHVAEDHEFMLEQARRSAPDKKKGKKKKGTKKRGG